MSNITVIIHSYSNIDILDCVQSALLLTKNIIIIGEEKKNDTKTKLDTLGVKIISFPNSGIVEPARNFGIQQAHTAWIFLLDADERITPELAKEIKETIKHKAFEFYQVPRKEILFHSYWLRYGGWYPNYQTRLIQRSEFIQWPSKIHATPEIKGKKGMLHNPLLHYSQNDISELVSRTIIFENNEANLLFEANYSASTVIFFRKFFGELYRRLIKWQGLKDGTIGIIESIYQAFSKTITYLFLYEKQSKKNRSL